MLIRTSVLLIPFPHFAHPSTQLPLGNHQLVLYDSLWNTAFFEVLTVYHLFPSGIHSTTRRTQSDAYATESEFWVFSLGFRKIQFFMVAQDLCFNFFSLHKLMLSKDILFLGLFYFSRHFCGWNNNNCGSNFIFRASSPAIQALILIALCWFPHGTLPLSYDDFVLKLWIFKIKMTFSFKLKHGNPHDYFSWSCI